LILRRLACRMARTLLRLRSRRMPSGEFKRVLVVSPHPDDETLGCGGTLARLGRAGAEIWVVFVTDGRASHPSHPILRPLDIKERRKSEARVSLGILGVAWDHVTMLDAVDGTLASLSNSEARTIEDLLSSEFQRTAPDAVFLPCRHDGSTEHDATFLLVTSAMRKSGKRPRIMEFPVWAWHNPLRLIEPLIKGRKVWRSLFTELRSTKVAAISSYATQTRPIAPETAPALPLYFVAELSHSEEFFFEK